MEVRFSFKTLVGGLCSFDQRDKKQSTEIVLLLSCSKSITNHKSLWNFQDMDNEVELILARATVFSIQESVQTMTICPSHRSSLGIGWTRGTDRCRVPYEISKHKNIRGKCPNADRGVSKLFSHVIWNKTGLLVSVGSGKSNDQHFHLCSSYVYIYIIWDKSSGYYFQEFADRVGRFWPPFPRTRIFQSKWMNLLLVCIVRKVPLNVKKLHLQVDNCT